MTWVTLHPTHTHTHHTFLHSWNNVHSYAFARVHHDMGHQWKSRQRRDHTLLTILIPPTGRCGW